MGKRPRHFSFGGSLANIFNHGTTTDNTSHTSPSLAAAFTSASTSSSGTGFVPTNPDLAPSVSSSTLSPSSFGGNSLYSSDFPSPSSTAPTSTGANDSLARFSKLYVHWDARPNQHQRDGYEKSLRPWLDEQIAQHTYGQKYAIELLSAGLTPGNLRLAIVISCPEAQTKKSVQSLLKRDKWLKSELLNYRLDLHVVYCNIGLAAGLQAHFSKQPELPQDPYLQLGADASTLCGQSVHISASDGRPTICFSFTATLLVGTELRGLYPAHPLLKGDRGVKVEQAPWPESPSFSEYDDSLEPFSLFYDSDDSTMSSALSPRSFLVPDDQIKPLSLLYNPDAEDDALYPVTRSPRYDTNLVDTPVGSKFPTIKQDPIGNEIGLRKVKVAELRKSDSMERTSNPGLDYALADLANAVAEVGQDFVADNTVDGEILTEFHRVESDCSTPVVVASPLATVHGHLRPSSVIFRADEVSYSLRLVELEQPLQRGASGSPVACGNKLCGFIAVVREDLPWAYMVPIDEVVADIEAVYRVEVSLPASTRQLVRAQVCNARRLSGSSWSKSKGSGLSLYQTTHLTAPIGSAQSVSRDSQSLCSLDILYGRMGSGNQSTNRGSAAESPTPTEGYITAVNGRRTAPKDHRFYCPSKNCSKSYPRQGYTRQGHYERHMRTCHAEWPTHNPAHSLRQIPILTNEHPDAGSMDDYMGVGISAETVLRTTPHPPLASSTPCTPHGLLEVGSERPSTPNPDNVLPEIIQFGTQTELPRHIQALLPSTLQSSLGGISQPSWESFDGGQNSLPPLSQTMSNSNQSFYSTDSYMKGQ